jgi:hypothetical protein
VIEDLFAAVPDERRQVVVRRGAAQRLVCCDRSEKLRIDVLILQVGAIWTDRRAAAREQQTR